MEIILKPLNGGSRFEFPSLPSEVSVDDGVSYQSYKIIGLGEVKIPKGTNCKAISWDSVFFGRAKKGELMMQNYTAPNSCVRILERFHDEGTPLQVLLTKVGINADMTISSFQWKPYGGHGNIRYSINFSEYKDLEVKVTKNPITKAAPDSVPDTPEKRPEPPAAKTYTIVSGDTLWKIATKFLGSGTQWTKIYDANSNVIEAAAKRYGRRSSDHGHWIYSGVTLTIPS